MLSAKFQSTHLREVRRKVSWKSSKSAWFQSTHLREVRLQSFAIDDNVTPVSIHAPA